MSTRSTRLKRRVAATDRALEELNEGPLTFGQALSSIRKCDEQSLAAFAEQLGISRQHLCDIEKGRRAVSPERAAKWAQILGQSERVFVRLALQDQIREAGLAMTVHIDAA